MNYSTSEQDRRTATEVFLALNGGGVKATAPGIWEFDGFRRLDNSLEFVARLRYRYSMHGIDLREEIILSPETMLKADGYGDFEPLSVFTAIHKELIAAITRLSFQIKQLVPDTELQQTDTAVPPAWLRAAAESLVKASTSSLRKMAR